MRPHTTTEVVALAARMLETKSRRPLSSRPSWARTKAEKRALPRLWKERTSPSGAWRMAARSWRRRRAEPAWRAFQDHAEVMSRAWRSRPSATDWTISMNARSSASGRGADAGAERGRGAHRPQAVALLEPAAVVDRAAHAEGLEVGDPGRRGDDDPGAGDVGPPAEVEVLAVEGHRPVEAAEGGEEVGPHEGGRAGDVEDVAHGVVLGLVEIAALDVVDRLAVAVGAHARPTAGGARRPTARPWARRRRRWSGRPPRPGGARCRGRGARRRGRTGGRRRPARRRGPRRPRRRSRGRCRGGAGGRRAARRRPGRAGGGVGAGGVDDEHRDVRVVLGRDARQGLLEPPAGVVRDDGDDHGRGGPRRVVGPGTGVTGGARTGVCGVSHDDRRG